MLEKYFEGYGFLNSITPEQYYAEPWSYVGYEYDSAGNEWDIVYNKSTNEYAYTTV